MTPALRNGFWTLALGAFGMCCPASVHAQGNEFNPYGNSGYADYREFAKPTYNNDPSLPGAARIQGGMYGRSRANQFESYLRAQDNAGGDDTATIRGSMSGVPYYRANSNTYDRTNNRAYRPNDTQADRVFRERQAERNAAYTQAMLEKDPRKRAALMRQIDRDSLDRPLSATTRNLAAQAKAAAEPANPRPNAAANARRPATTTVPPATRDGRVGTAKPNTATRPKPAAATTPAAEPAAIDPNATTTAPPTIPVPAPR